MQEEPAPSPSSSCHLNFEEPWSYHRHSPGMKRKKEEEEEEKWPISQHFLPLSCKTGHEEVRRRSFSMAVCGKCAAISTYQAFLFLLCIELAGSEGLGHAGKILNIVVATTAGRNENNQFRWWREIEARLEADKLAQFLRPFL